jgi:hypothetical protein
MSGSLSESSTPSDVWAVTKLPPTGGPTGQASGDAGDPDTIAAIIRCLGADPSDIVTCPDGARRSLADALGMVCDIERPAALALEVLASRAPEFGESRCLQALAEGYPGAEPADADLLDLLHAFPSARPPVQELISALALRPPCDRERSGAGSAACKKERRPMQTGPVWFASRIGGEPMVMRRADDHHRDDRRRGASSYPAGGLWARLQQGATGFVRAAAARTPFTRASKAG